MLINDDTESVLISERISPADFLRAHESKANALQQFYYAIVLPAIIQGWFTTGALRQNIGVAANYDGDIWNVTTVVYAMFALPRLHDEKNTGGKMEAFIFWATALFNAFILLPATMASIASVTIDAKKTGDFKNVFWVSEKESLGNNTILFVEQLAYAVSMLIATLDQMNRFKKSDNPRENKLNFFSIVREGSCAAGAFLAALSMMVEGKTQSATNTASLAFYLLTIGMNVGELLGKCIVKKCAAESESVYSPC